MLNAIAASYEEGAWRVTLAESNLRPGRRFVRVERGGTETDGMR